MEENTVEAQPERTNEEIWNADFDLGRVDDENVPSAPVPSETKEENTEVAETEEPKEVPSEEVPEEKVEEPETEEPEEELQVEEIPTKKFSRTRLRQIEKEVLIPLTDPDVDVKDAFEALRNLAPQRTQEILASAVRESATAYPDDWLQVITGIEGITVDGIKEKFSDVEQAKSEPQFADAEQRLTELYGEDWRDPNNDGEMLDEDKFLAQILRTIDGQKGVKDQEIEALRKQLDELQPKIDEVTTAQEAEFQARFQETFNNSVNEFRGKVEKSALPKLFEETGLNDSADDTDSVKALKASIRQSFEPEYDLESAFDRFLMHGYEQKEMVGKVIGRVGKYLEQAAQAEVLAMKDKKNADRYKAEARSLRQQADDERDALTVLTRKAAKSFLESPYNAARMKVLEENADLQRRLSQVTGRKEVVGQTVPSMSDPWRDKIKEDPWNTDVLDERLAGIARR